MALIDVSFTPDLVPLKEMPVKTAVVVDILRATSSWITALYHGAKSILPVETLEECRKLKGMGYLTAAERGGMKVDGFDFGNSPIDYINGPIQDKSIAVTTTNGSSAILKASTAKEILIGSFLNMDVLSNYLNKKKNIQIICAGWEGQPCLEDTLFSGALVQSLLPFHHSLSDSAKMALRLFLRSPRNPYELVKNASHVKRLNKLGLENDISFCFKMNVFPILAYLKEGHIIKFDH